MTKDIAFTIAGPVATKRRASSRSLARWRGPGTTKAEGGKSRDGTQTRGLHSRKSRE